MKRTVLAILWSLVSVIPVLAATESTPTDSSGIKYIAAGLAVGLACIGAGLAVGKIGAAAMGALSEKPELSGKAFTFIGLAEGICLWGFLVAMLVLFL
jgi:V/A-type H+-transporting ATPase subunit K